MEKVRETKRFVDLTAQAVHNSRETYHRLASDFDEAEGALNEGLGCIHGTRERERERAGLFE